MPAKLSLCAIKLALLFALPTFAQAKPVIMTTVEPVAMLARAVVGDMAEVDTLLPAGSSPHHVSLRVSDRQRLSQSQLLIWIGPSIERYLQPLANNMPSLRLSQVDSSLEKNEGSSDQHSHHHDHDHDLDAHIWLNPDLAQEILMLIAQHMAVLDGANKQLYLRNAQQEQALIASKAIALNQSLDSTSARVFAVTHNAYGHLLDYFDLPAPVIITQSPEMAPSAKRLWQLDKELEEGSCVLVEPEYRKGWVKKLVQKQNYRMVEADVLGSQTETDHYSAWLDELVVGIDGCVNQSE